MTKVESTIIKQFSLFMIILVVAILGIGEQTGTFDLFGGTVLSVDKVQYTSNDPLLDKEAFLITLATTGQGEFIKGSISTTKTISADLLSTDDGIATESISIKSTISDYRCQYPVQALSTKLYDYTLVDTCGKLDIFCRFSFNDACIARGADYYVDADWAQYYCMQKTIVATKGLIGDSFFNFKTTFDVTIADKTEQLILTPQKTSAMTPTNTVNVAWTGNTVSGQNCPQPVNNNIGLVRYDNSWQTVELDKLNAYTSVHQIILDNCISAAKNTIEGTICIDNANFATTSAIVHKKFTFDNIDAFVSSNVNYYQSTGDGVLVLNLDKLLQFPIYTLIVDADALNIVKLVGTPKIVRVVGSTLTTGSSGIITTTIKNIGDATGSFALTANCDLPFSYTGASMYSTLQPGQSEIIIVPINGECNEKLDGTCELVLTDRNNPNKFDTMTVSMGCTPLFICIDGQTKCIGEVEFVCEGGTSWIKTGTTNCEEKEDLTCQVDKDCDDDNWLTIDTCEGIKVAGIDTGIDKKCHNKDITEFLLIFGVIISIMILMIPILLLFRNKKVKMY